MFSSKLFRRRRSNTTDAPAKPVIQRKKLFLEPDALELVNNLRPHLRAFETKQIVDQFQRASGSFTSMLPRAHFMELVKRVTNDYEYRSKLHDIFGQPGLTFKQFVAASPLWINPTPSEKLRIQFLIFNVSHNGWLSPHDRSVCLQYGMARNMREVMEHMEGSYTCETFVQYMQSHGIHTVSAYYLGPLLHVNTGNIERSAAQEAQRSAHEAHFSSGLAGGYSELEQAMQSAASNHFVTREPEPQPNAPERTAHSSVRAGLNAADVTEDLLNYENLPIAAVAIDETGNGNEFVETVLPVAAIYR